RTGLFRRSTPFMRAGPARSSPSGNSGTDREPMLSRRVFPHHVDILHARSGRAAPAPIEHRVDPLVVALEHRFDGSIGSVPDPPGEPERAGAVACLRSEEDALNGAADDDVRSLNSRSPPGRRAARSGRELSV